MASVLVFSEVLFVLWAFCLTTKKFFASLNRAAGVCAACLVAAQSHAVKTLQQLRSLTAGEDVQVRCLYNSRRVERVQNIIRQAPHLLTLWLLLWELSDFGVQMKPF